MRITTWKSARSGQIFSRKDDCLGSTRYYYSLVPTLADTIYDRCGEFFDDIVPGVEE